MKLTLKIALTIFILITTALACSLPIKTTPSSEDVENQASTAVAATLTAIVLTPAPHGEITTTPVIIPSETPTTEPTSTSTPMVESGSFRLAYTDRNGNIWTWTQASSYHQIISSGDVEGLALSQDGQRIAFSRTSSDYMEHSLWAINFDGSNEHLLVSHDDFMSMPLSSNIQADWVIARYPFMIKFVPGSNTSLAFITVPQFEGPGFIDNKDLWLVDVETGTRTNVLPAGSGGHFYYSPDGSQIAIVTGSDISLVNADGTNRRSSVLSYEPVLTYSESEYHAFPQWSPDGNFLRVAIPYHDSLGDPSMPGHLYQLPMDGSPATFIGNVNFAPITGGVFSPDLSKLAFIQLIGDSADNKYAMMISNHDGTEPIEIARDGLGFSGWSPDSNHFAYIIWNPRIHLISQVSTSGSLAIDVTNSDNLNWISEDQFIFIRMNDPNWEIRMGSIGSPSILIVNLAAGDRSPSYAFSGTP